MKRSNPALRHRSSFPRSVRPVKQTNSAFATGPSTRVANVARAASEIVKTSIKQGNRVGAEIGAVARSALEGIAEGLAEAGESKRLGDFGLIHVPHRGNVVRNVVDAALAITRDFSRVGEVIDRMHDTRLSPEGRMHFARQALAVRYLGDQHRPFTADMLLSARRQADEGDDLWRSITSFKRTSFAAASAGGRSIAGSSPARPTSSSSRLTMALARPHRLRRRPRWRA